MSTPEIIMNWYDHDDETGMEYWHDGDSTRQQCHDGVGLITCVHQSFDDFLTQFPNAVRLDLEVP